MNILKCLRLLLKTKKKNRNEFFIMDVKKEIEEKLNEENIIKILKHYNCNPVVNINEYIIFICIYA